MRASSPVRRDLYYLLLLMPALLLYALANNGWGYTYCPLISIVLLFTGWAGTGECVAQRPGASRATSLCAAIYSGCAPAASRLRR